MTRDIDRLWNKSQINRWDNWVEAVKIAEENNTSDKDIKDYYEWQRIKDLYDINRTPPAIIPSQPPPTPNQHQVLVFQVAAYILDHVQDRFDSDVITKIYLDLHAMTTEKLQQLLDMYKELCKDEKV